MQLRSQLSALIFYFDMKKTRENMNEYWDLRPKTFDTVLGITGAKQFTKGSDDEDDEDYGISGLAGACGSEKRY